MKWTDYISAPSIIIFLSAAFSAWAAWRDHVMPSWHKKASIIAAVISAVAALWGAFVQGKTGYELRGYVTGGNSYPIFDVSLGRNTDEPVVMMWVEGEFPVYDVNVVIDDIVHAAQLSKFLKPEEMLKLPRFFSQTFLILYHGSRVDLLTLHLSGVDQGHYSGTIRTRSGIFEELFQLRRIHGKWLSALHCKGV